ncbi:MAG: BatD family protein [Chlamydiales bacterium]|nr:BatD family protein [Chlamydiales bacterium]
MVKKTFLTFVVSAFFLGLTPAVSFAAGEFTASVVNKQVYLSESFSLSLTLKDTYPKESPDISVLKKHFSVHSKHHSTSTTIVNGKSSSNIIWKLSLTPKVEGLLDIPPISVETADGVLSTEPVTLNVVKGSSTPSRADDVGVKVVTKASNAAPYKNEPFIYTAFLASKMPLSNVKTQKLQMQDAIVDLLEEPKLEEKVIGGVLFNVVEFNFLVTPLKTGSLTIPSMAIQGAVPQRRTTGQSSYYNDGFDPFGLIPGFDRLKPFNVNTEEVQLDVQAPVSEVSPWLPAKALKLEEQWTSGQTLRVGEPFSRGFLIKAEGLKASQLPRLEDLQSHNSEFKIYADKPEEQEKIVQGIIHSTRKEHYTLIPQQEGTWVLPEISISWWDSAKKEKRISTLPERTVQILPALEAVNSVPEESTSVSNTTTGVAVSPPLLLYGLIGILTFFLMAALLWGFTLHRKIVSLTKDFSQKPTKKVPVDEPQKSVSPPVAVIHRPRKEKLPDLNPT